jgi:hypothetical protein
MAARSEAKSAREALRQNLSIFYFRHDVRLPLLVSLRSATFSEKKIDN